MSGWGRPLPHCTLAGSARWVYGFGTVCVVGVNWWKQHTHLLPYPKSLYATAPVYSSPTPAGPPLPTYHGAVVRGWVGSPFTSRLSYTVDRPCMCSGIPVASGFLYLSGVVWSILYSFPTPPLTTLPNCRLKTVTSLDDETYVNDIPGETERIIREYGGGRMAGL